MAILLRSGLKMCINSHGEVIVKEHDVLWLWILHLPEGKSEARLHELFDESFSHHLRITLDGAAPSKAFLERCCVGFVVLPQAMGAVGKHVHRGLLKCGV